jgi:hypothetical protein
VILSGTRGGNGLSLLRGDLGVCEELALLCDCDLRDELDLEVVGCRMGVCGVVGRDAVSCGVPAREAAVGGVLGRDAIGVNGVLWFGNCGCDVGGCDVNVLAKRVGRSTTGGNVGVTGCPGVVCDSGIRELARRIGRGVVG